MQKEQSDIKRWFQNETTNVDEKKKKLKRKKIQINEIWFHSTKRCENDKCEMTRANDAMSLIQRNDETETHREKEKLVWWDVDIQLNKQISGCNASWID